MVCSAYFSSPTSQCEHVFFEDAPRVGLPGDVYPFDMGADIIGDGSVSRSNCPVIAPAIGASS